MRCFVRQCRYVAESSIEDFRVCLLHDHPNVRAILERGEAPAAYLTRGVPIVMPAGELTFDDFIEREGGISPLECAVLAEAPEGPHSFVHPEYALDPVE